MSTHQASSAFSALSVERLADRPRWSGGGVGTHQLLQQIVVISYQSRCSHIFQGGMFTSDPLTHIENAVSKHTVDRFV